MEGELDQASGERGAEVLAGPEQKDWGLVDSLGEDERVWELDGDKGAWSLDGTSRVEGAWWLDWNSVDKEAWMLDGASVRGRTPDRTERLHGMEKAGKMVSSRLISHSAITGFKGSRSMS